jgi:ribonuclease-3 family protein
MLEGGMLSQEQVQALSPVALAYIGDAVYELFVRSAFLLPPQKINAYHRQVVSQVRAEQQALRVEQLLPRLTTYEQEVLRRGRNAASKGPKRLKASIYQQATGFESLIGYLYLTDPARLADLLGYIDLSPPNHGSAKTHPQTQTESQC